MSPPDYTGVLKVLYDWQTLITGLLAIVSASIAYKATRQAADKQIAAIKSSVQADTLLRLMDRFDSEEFSGETQKRC